MKDITIFVQNELYPALFRRIGDIFPEMQFKWVRGKWCSPKNIDGSDPKNHRHDKTVITSKRIGYALENGEGGKRDLITLYKELNNLHTDIEAIKAIAKDLSLEVPDDPEAERRWKARKEEEEKIALSYDRQKRALFSPEGAAALQYLKETRGYSEEDIKQMGLGYLSPDEGARLQSETKIGIPSGYEKYPISIPYYSNGDLKGFKLRTITDVKPKYLNTLNLNSIIVKYPFGLSPLTVHGGTDQQREIVVVEGELDALHAIVKGVTNIIATTGGGGLTEERVQTLKDKGYKHVIMLLDNDKAGAAATLNSIKAIEKLGLYSYVATIPEGKDTDEYLRNHSGDDLRKVIDSHESAARYLYTLRLEQYQNGSRTKEEQNKFIDDIVALANHTKKETDRGELLDLLTAIFPMELENFKKGIEEKAERERREEEEQQLSRETNEILSKASQSLTKGELTEAAKQAKNALDKLQSVQDRARYATLFKDNTEELWKSYKEIPQTLRTAFKLSRGQGEEYYLSFPSGSISVVAAPTNHGKSKILQSLALDALTLKEKGTLLYFTFEENEQKVNIQFLNAYADIEVTKQSAKHGNVQTITEYLQSGSTKFMRNGNGEQAQFIQREQEWKEIRKKLRIKIIKPDTNYIEELIALIRYGTSTMDIRAIFIDYVQELYVESKEKRIGRTDELKEVMVQLDQIAQETNIPIIAAAQLRREVQSPFDLINQNIADSGWIERKASEILLVWSNKEPCNDPALKKKLEEPKQPTATLELGKGGKLFFKLSKSRSIPTGATAIVEINGNTGRVHGNTEIPQIEGAEQSLDFKEETEPQKPQAPGARSLYPSEGSLNDKRAKDPILGDSYDPEDLPF